MKEIELFVELPASDAAEAELPDAEALPRSGPVATVSGLNGDQVLQLAIIVTTGSVGVLRTWLLARAERLKHTRVVWDNREFDGYTPREIELLMQVVNRVLSEEHEEPQSGDLPPED